MRKTIKRISTLLLVITAMLSVSLTAFAAEASVTYEGGAENFVFLPGSQYTDTDLFDNFKDVMPGDTLTQKITVRNSSRDSDYVKLYMRAVAHDETTNPLSPGVAAGGETMVTMTEFLSRLSMTVKADGTVISQAAADQLGGLKEDVYLGDCRYGESIELTVELSVPIELDNKYANRIGEVDWVFKVEEIDVPDPTPAPTPTPAPGNSILPQTGDHTPILLYAVMLLGGLCGVVVLMRRIRYK